MTALLAWLPALLLLAPPARAGDTAAVVVSGRARDTEPVYVSGGRAYLDAKDAGRIYGGEVYWYPVSGRVRLSLRGRSLQFVVDSRRASSGDETFDLDAPVIVRASRAFVPVSFLCSEAFSRWSGFDSRYDAATRTLQVDRRATVGPVHAFSYRGRTRIEIGLTSDAVVRVTPRGAGAVEVGFPFGVVDGDEAVDVGDGIVAAYAVKQLARQAVVTARFAAPGLRWRTLDLAGPRRLALDVFSRDAAPDAARGVPAAAGPRKRLIVIDAGHGGKDPGAVGPRGTQEKDVNLAVALELQRVLRARGDFDVRLTRSSDTFVPLSGRSEQANAAAADLFVSLHCNSSPNRGERGVEVYSVSETASDPEAERLAETENAALELEGKNPQDEAAKLILLAMTKTEMINESAPFAALVERAVAARVPVPRRGAKQAGFYVLRGTHAPAILIETAFISNSQEEAELGSRRFRRKLADGVAAGIADYARKKGWLR